MYTYLEADPNINLPLAVAVNLISVFLPEFDYQLSFNPLNNTYRDVR